jgi:hypothetical protein
LLLQSADGDREVRVLRLSRFLNVTAESSKKTVPNWAEGVDDTSMYAIERT